MKLSPRLARTSSRLRKLQGGWLQLVYFVVTLVISIALAPKPPKPKPAALDDFDIPVAEEDRPIPVLFGTHRITGANIVWYGNLSVKKIKESGLFGSSTVGYKYFLGMHMALGHGPFDAVTKIETADKEAWSGNLTATGNAVIDKPKLYGGKKREGGIKGTARVLFGEPTQAVDTYLQAQQGTPLPAYRGVTSIVWSNGAGAGGYVGNTPYVKAWAVTGRRILKGWTNDAPWYSATAAIGTAMNPAHIIYQCLTDLEWGMGAPVDQIDTVSFTAAADTLYAEGFGLNMLWNQSTTIEAFVGIVLDHIAGVLAFDQTTGKYLLSLVRADYDEETLPIFDPSNVISVENFERRSWGETVNELTLTYTDASTRKPTTIVVQDLGNIAAQGVRIPDKADFSGIDDPALMRIVAGRELSARSTPLARMDLITDRSLWRQVRSNCIRVEWPQYNLPLTVFRILSISRGTLNDGKMRVSLVQDIYSLAGIEYSGEQTPDPTPDGIESDDPTVGPSNVISNTVTAPPGSPADGDRYYIPSSPAATGAWAGHEGELAEWDEDGQEWIFSAVGQGSIIFNEDDGSHFTVDEYGNTSIAPWIPSALLTAEGDLIVRGATGPEALPAGSEDEVLTIQGGVPAWAPSAGGGGGGGAGAVGSMAFVTESIVTGSATTNITISGLDLDADEKYQIEVNALGATGSTASLSIFLNGDTTATNYERSTITDGGNGKGDEAIFGALVGARIGLWDLTLARGIDGRAIVNVIGGRSEATVIATQQGTVIWDTNANVTSITINSSVASGFAVGTRVRIWKVQTTYGGGHSGAVVSRLALQSFSTTAQAVSWDTEEIDEENYFDAGNPTRITIPVDGWYTLVGTVIQSADPDDMQTLYFSKNGAAFSSSENQTRLGAGSTSVAVSSQLVETDFFDAGDYLELFVDNRSGSSSAYARLSIRRESGPTGPTGPAGATGSLNKTRLIYCTGDETRSSTTTLVDDPVLKCELEANTAYRLQFDIYWDAAPTPDFKYDLNFTGVADSTMEHAIHSPLTTASLPTGDSTTTLSNYLCTSLNDARTFTISGTDTVTLQIWLTIQVGATGGTLSFRWAQGTSSATACKRRKDSCLLVEKYTDAGDIDTVIAADSPRGYWKLDEASGNLADSSGNGYTLTITGSPINYYQFIAMDPKFPTRKTLVANGGTQSNYAASASALGLTLPVTTYTMEAWGRWTSGGIVMAIGANGETAATNFAGQMLITSGGLLSQFWEYGAGTNAPTINSLLGGILDGKLHHLASTKDAATRTVAYYIDGQYVGGGTYTAGQEHTGGTSGVFSIIGSPGDSTAAPDGAYGGAAFYTTVLTEAEIQAHARALGLFSN